MKALCVLNFNYQYTECQLLIITIITIVVIVVLVLVVVAAVVVVIVSIQKQFLPEMANYTVQNNINFVKHGCHMCGRLGEKSLQKI